MLAFALRRIYRIPTSWIYVHRGQRTRDKSGVLRKLSLPSIVVAEVPRGMMTISQSISDYGF